MLLNDILNDKGRDVLTISPSASLADVVQTLVQNRCGALVVCQGTMMVGIISERDILRVLAETTESLDRISVQAHMTEDVITGAPDDNINKIMGLMTVHRIRHLPIVLDGQLAGLISIGDIVKAQHNQLTMENHYLKSYIQG